MVESVVRPNTEETVMSKPSPLTDTELDIAYRKGATDQEIEAKVGVNRKRQVNLYDPDGTRVELMETNTIDGKPAPPSTAPPPVAEPRP